MFLLWLRQLPWCGDWTPASVSPPAEGSSSPTNTPVSPASSFILPSFAWVCIFFSSGQVLLSALSWCMHFCVWRCIPDVSMERDVLHIHLLLHHLVLPPVSFFIIIIVVFAFSVILLLNLTQDPQWHSSSCCLFAIIWNWTLATIITTKIDSS